ncbi:MAG: STAS domain-containing protein, partial [Bacteroidales bacterium]
MIRKESASGGFALAVATDEPVVRIRPEGRLDTVNSAFFASVLHQWLDREEFLIIDFSGCSYLSSSGIRALILANRQLTGKGGALLVASLTSEVQQVLGMTGLDAVLPIFGSPSLARDEAARRRELSRRDTTLELEGFSLSFRILTSAGSQALLWQEGCLAGYDELGFAVGSGSPAESPEEEVGLEGLFVTLGNCSGLIPLNRSEPSDFRVVQDPSAAGIYLRWAGSFGTQPAAFAEAGGDQTIPAGRWLDLLGLIPEKTGTPPLRAVLTTGLVNGQPCLLFGWYEGGGASGLEPGTLPDSLVPFGSETPGGARFTGIRFTLGAGEQLTHGEPPAAFLGRLLTIVNIERVELPDLTDPLSGPAAWLFQAGSWTKAGTQQIGVGVDGEVELKPYQAWLTRRLFTDSARVLLKPLRGGFSAQTFQVDSFDAAGRKLRPTVLKIGSREMITREADRCRQYAMPYILNNSAMVLGTAFYCGMGALRYNFVGIGGEDTRLKWLHYYYKRWPVVQLEPLFDKIFLQILKPWYGQAVGEAIYPYRDHDPTLTFFPALVETAQETLGIGPEQTHFRVDGLDREFLNPYRFLREEYPRRRERSYGYLTAICHGDLNMQNILLDEGMNVYLIDFSETRPRAAISDFARLEAIFLIEHAPLEEEGDLAAMVDLAARLFAADSLEHRPDTTWTGRAPEVVGRNIAMTLKMRSYA